MTIEAVIFDLDDTLYDERQFVRSGHRAVSNYLAEKYGVNRESCYRLLSSIFSKQGRSNLFDSALQKLNIYNKETVQEMVRVYRNHLPKIFLFKEAQKLLLKLKEKYRLGLITDGALEVQKNKVKTLKIQDFFDVITYAVEYGGKHSVEPFLATLKKLKVPASQSIYVDDNPLKGFSAARKTGIRTVRILTGPSKNLRIVDEGCKPEFEIQNLQQLFKVIYIIQEEVPNQNVLDSN